jgi:hypothetical protein
MTIVGRNMYLVCKHRDAAEISMFKYLKRVAGEAANNKK